MSAPGVHLIVGVELDAKDRHGRTFAEVLGYPLGARVGRHRLDERLAERGLNELEVESLGYGGEEIFLNVIGVAVCSISESDTSLPSVIPIAPVDLDRAYEAARERLRQAGFDVEPRIYVTWRAYQ